MKIRIPLPIAVLCIALVGVSNAHADLLLVGGTGSAEPLMRRLFDGFQKQSPADSLKVVNPSLGSAGGIRALSMGKVDLAVSARPLKEDEKSALGQHFELCSTPFVLVTNGGKYRNGFSTDELARIYDGQLQKWEDGSLIRLVLRTRDDADSTQLKSMSPSMDKAVIAADQRQGMVYGKDDLDTLDLLSRTPGSLGPTSLGLLRTTASGLALIPLNGQMPSVSSMTDGKYPWRKTLTVILPAKPSTVAVRFVEFLHSATADEIMRRYEYRPDHP